MRLALQNIQKIPSGVSRRRIQRTLQSALKRAAVTGRVSLTVVWTDDREMRRLNRKFRGRDCTTDVLSFPLGGRFLSGGERELGDIVISVPEAKRQALRTRRSYHQETSLLLVHGALHLLGFDHQDRKGRLQMRRLERAILRPLGAA